MLVAISLAFIFIIDFHVSVALLILKATHATYVSALLSSEFPTGKPVNERIHPGKVLRVLIAGILICIPIKK